MRLVFQQIRYRFASFGNRSLTERYCFRLPFAAPTICFHTHLRRLGNRPPPPAEGDHYGLRLNLNFRAPFSLAFSNAVFSIQGDFSNDKI